MCLNYVSCVFVGMVVCVRVLACMSMLYASQCVCAIVGEGGIFLMCILYEIFVP